MRLSYNVGIVVAKESLEVVEVLRVLNHDEDCLPVVVRERCEAIVPHIAEVKSKGAAETFLFLKAHYVYMCIIYKAALQLSISLCLITYATCNSMINWKKTCTL